MNEERRLVTVLFADVVGSTAMGEALDVEDVRALLGRLFATATDAVERHGGRVEKFIGDAVMAVFGLPTAHDDDAARALSAAIDLRDRVRADPALGERMPIRLGVNSGEVIATRDEDATQFLVTGDPVNVAARLQQGAEAWSIIVGERTARAVGERFRFGPQIEVEAKGKAAPLQARELRGVASGRARRVGRIVGRDADLDQLELTARRTFEERRPFLVSMIAPAGVGKSRLLEEFISRLDPGAHVAMAQCLPYGQRLTYWPMRSILLSTIGLAEDTTPEAMRTALVAWLRQSGEPDPDRSADLLAATIGAKEVEGGDRIAVHTAWRRFVELAAEWSPLVLVIEDLHWSSDSLLDLIEAMLQPRVDVPLLMVVLARPELLDRRPGWGGGRRNAVSISLEPLQSGAVAELVADLLDRPDPDIVTAVVERAEGNPFYAGEIVRSLVDRLGPAPDPAAVPGAIEALPDTVHGTVLARLDALEPEARRAVQLGAVLGRTFEPRALPALDATMTPADAEVAVEGLLDRDLVRPTGRSALTFRHILIREVAYGTLPRAERARLHGAAGLWLEAEATATGREDELAELVAFHFREATTLGRLLATPPEVDLGPRAVAWLRRAADAAAAGAAAVEAARHLNAAIELAPRELQPDLLERLGEIWVSGDQALEAFDRAHALGQELGLGSEQALRTLSQAMIVRTRWTGSVSERIDEDEFDRRIAEIAKLLEGDVSPRARLLGQLALAFRPMIINQPGPGDSVRAAAAANTAIEMARELDDVDMQSAAMDAAGTAAYADDRPERSLAFARPRLELGERLTTGERLDAQIVIAWMNSFLGNLEESERAADQARAGLGRGQASAWVLGVIAWRMLALFFLGRWDEAMQEAERAERVWTESEIRAPWYALNGILAAFLISSSRGDAVGMDRWREHANRIFDASDPGIRTHALRSLVQGDPAKLANDVIGNFRRFTGRVDYLALTLWFLGDRRQPVPGEVLDDLVAYTAERGLRLVLMPALRLRGLLRRDAGDLRAALDVAVEIHALPTAARLRTELGLLSGDPAMIARGMDELDSLGDVGQSARAAAETRAAGPANVPGRAG
ncbi:MAG: AAA family ATPase [Chloroflexi bacterium]|nr:AAA family ATPase [Chloroflexota bacterium]